MKEETIENIRRGWKVQTFQYDYISHLKYGFSFAHFMIFTSSFFLMFVHTFLGLLAVPCMVSWNYFVFFDKRRKMYKDSYVPLRYELMGTLFATVLYCTVLGMFCFGHVKQHKSDIISVNEHTPKTIKRLKNETNKMYKVVPNRQHGQ